MRGLGIGRELIDEICARAQRHDIRFVQLFSATKDQGLEQARAQLAGLLSGSEKKASGAEYRGTPEAKSTGLG